MTKTPNKTPKLSLAVQYGINDEHLARWRIRRWVLGALQAADTSGIDQLTLTIRLVGQREGKTLNQTYRHKDYATNVLTFEYDSTLGQEPCVMADIVICTPVLKAEAKSQHKTYLHHAAHLVVHGTLHALGYDHLEAEQATAMESIETRVLARWGIADPYAS